MIELLVVLTVIALMLSLAVPRYFNSVERSKETILRENLKVMRTTIDKFYGDSGRYPEHLEELVTRQYLRAIPPDPYTESTTSWISVASPRSEQKGLYDVKSGAKGKAQDGTPLGEL